MEWNGINFCREVKFQHWVRLCPLPQGGSLSEPEGAESAFIEPM